MRPMTEKEQINAAIETPGGGESAAPTGSEGSEGSEVGNLPVIKDEKTLLEELLAQDGQPWSRREGERLRDYTLFIRYATMLPRPSVERMARERRLSYPRICSIAKHYDWQARCDGLWAALERQRVIELGRAYKLMGELEAESTVLLQKIVVTGAQRKLKAMLKDADEKLSAKDISLLHEIVSKSSRVLRGEPSEISKVIGPAGSVSDVLGTELDALSAKAREARDRQLVPAGGPEETPEIETPADFVERE